ncbi:MAG: hypothetical protein ACTSO9_07125 [Candidatus Helarchaeota archaeon]
MHLVDELWIVTRDGITIYNQKTESSMNEHMFGGFIAAINKFVEAIGGDTCEKIIMGKSKLFIMSCDNSSLFFISRSDQNVKDKKIQEYIDKIKNRFLNNFEKELKCFNGNLDSFKNIEKIINIREDADNFLGLKIDKKMGRNILSKL